MPRPMKDSGVKWLGEIPAHWDVLNLGAVTETMRNGYVGPTKDLFVDDGIKYIQSLHIKDGRINFSRHEYYVSETWANIHPKIKKNDVLIVQTGDIGNVGLVTDEYDNCNCHALIIATPRTDLIFPNYLTYYLRSAVGRELLLFYKTGALLPHLNSGKIKFANICVPPLDEQQRIATFLDGECARIDSVIEKTRASIVEYKKLKQAIITRAVTKGIRPARPMKDSGVEWLGDIPADWETSRVGLHFDIILGKMLCPNQLSADYTFEPYYCAANVHFEGITNDGLKQMWFSTLEKEQYSVAIGDLLVVEGGAGAGGCAIVTEIKQPTYIQNSIMIVRPKMNSSSRYLKYLLEHLVKSGYLDVVCNKATIPHFTKEKLANVPMLISCEQKEIAQYLDEKTAAIDLLVEKKNQLATELERLKKSLIFEYVTGKKELTGGDLV